MRLTPSLRGTLEAADDPTLILVVTTLAMYLGVVYVFSFSQAASSGRLAIHTTILMMDVTIAAQLARDGLGPARLLQSTRNGMRQIFLCALAYGSLLGVIALHVDYALTRYRGAEEGAIGSLLTLKSILLALQLAYVFFIALVTARPRARPATLAPFEPDAQMFLLFSLPLVPLVTYRAHNGTLFSLLTTAEYFAFFLICPVAAFLLLQLLQQALNAPAIAAPLVAGLTFVYYSMPLVSSILRRPVENLFWVHLSLAVVLPGALAAMYLANKRSTTRALAAIAACGVAGSVIHGMIAKEIDDRPTMASVDRSATEPSPLAEFMSSPLKRQPDVYLLVYDGYAPSAMMKTYGINDDAVTDLLTRTGFKVYDETYSLFLSSRPSMTSLMDMRTAPRAGIGSDNTAITFFSRHGYKTHLILNSYLLQGSLPIVADFVFPNWSPRSGLSALYRGIGGGEFKSEIVFQDSDRDQWLAAKRSVLGETIGGPKMLYAHSAFPGHSQNSGNCLPDETQRYAARLAVAREEMRADIEATQRSHREAIIIIAGDHGAYLTGDCLYMTRHNRDELTAVHFADRYGAKLAIRWPDGAAEVDRTQTIQDVFFAVSAYLLDDDRVWRHRLPTETIGYSGIPQGAVKDGVVLIGKDKGRPLFH